MDLPQVGEGGGEGVLGEEEGVVGEGNPVEGVRIDIEFRGTGQGWVIGKEVEVFWQRIIGGERDGIGTGANVGAMIDREGFCIMVQPIEGGMDGGVEIGGQSASA